MAQTCAEEKVVAAAVKAKPNQMVHNEDYSGIAQILSQSGGISFDEFVIKKGDFSVSLKVGAGATTGATTASASPVAAAATASAGASNSSAVAATTNSAQAASASTPTANAGEFSHTINSPITGTFYSASSPSAPKFVEIGKSVKAGDIVCTVEAMKLYNEIKSTKDGVVAAILAKDGDVVQKGQALIGLK